MVNWTGRQHIGVWLFIRPITTDDDGAPTLPEIQELLRKKKENLFVTRML